MPGLFDDLAMPADLRARFHPISPASGRRIASADDPDDVCWLDLLGWNSQAAQDYRYGRDERLRKLGRDFTSEEAFRDFGDFLATLTADWHLVAPTGRVLGVECNYDTARQLWNGTEFRWLRQQAMDFLNAEGNFIPASWRR